jgi:citrate lyase beta subunit
MTQKLSPYHLGATLYMPATHPNLLEIILFQKIADLRSMVICLEDALSEDQVITGLSNLKHCLLELQQQAHLHIRPLVFIRPRHPNMASKLLSMEGIDSIDGFVLPKFDNHSFTDWYAIIQQSPAHFMFMPTLETTQMLDVDAVRQLCKSLQDDEIKCRILALRIGGNDLMSRLRLRTHHAHTLYDGPLGYVVAMLVTHFAPAGFYLTAPVFDYFQDHTILKAEFQRDLLYGLVGKTVIHPNQISVIHQLLKVDSHDFNAAQQILDSTMPSVFQLDGVMCEPATHRHWAIQVMERAHHFGVTKKMIENKISNVDRQFNNYFCTSNVDI